ncbi:MAG: 2-isopropylmalate synthase [Verrucomicrobia bacterium]|nr:2-isopropylmalate synthase [Verrucomicrobiota bacterium]
MAEQVLIFDTTLRDGEQSPGAAMGVREKLEIAKQLQRLQVDVIEAGFPVSSKEQFEAVRLIAEEVRGCAIAGLARCVRKDVDAAAEALKNAAHPRIHVFLATSEIHRKYKLKKAKDEILKAAVEMTAYAKTFCNDVEFSPEDASRTELDFLAEVFDAVVEAGASTVNIPDTVGYALPGEFGEVIRTLRDETKHGRDVVIAVHCHNDLGLAVANSLAGVMNGARQVECTINGLGERAGNCSLEEVVMAIKTRTDRFAGLKTNVRSQEIVKASRLVSRLSGMVVQPNKAIVGDNAFAHESGIHVHGVLSDSRTYEIMKPADVGWTESKIVLGRHSGKHGLRMRAQKLGYELSDVELTGLYEAFIRLADKKKEVYDDDLAALIEEAIVEVPETYRLDYLSNTSGNRTVPTATVRLLKGTDVLQDASTGDGPVDAAYKTIDRITKVTCTLVDFSLRAVTSGKDALGEVSVRLRSGLTETTGRGTSTDIIEASAKAYLNAVNRLIVAKTKR